jgi:hypothetical protein
MLLALRDSLALQSDIFPEKKIDVTINSIRA